MTGTIPDRPRILLTNDDGVRSPGLLSAYEALAEVADVTVVAPTDQRSGASHMITLETPLRAFPLSDLPGYRVDFTPVDCVKLALKQLLPERPDLVVSGINWGYNAGFLVHYSGTVAAATEAALLGIPAVAISLCSYRRKPDFATAGRVTRAIVEGLRSWRLPDRCVLNVNVPPRPWEELSGFRWCRQSLEVFEDEYEKREDPRRKPYYWLTGSLGALEGQAPDDDLTAVKEGYVSLTPLTIDWTHEAVYADEGAGADGLAAGLDAALRE